MIDGEYALIGEDGDHFLKPNEKRQSIFVSGKFNVNNHAHLIGSSESCGARWFCHYFERRDITSFLSRQGANRFKLSKASLEKIPILLPPLPEQKAIADTLSTWDTAIATLERLIAAKERSFRHVRAQTIHDVSRVHGASQPLNKVFKPLTRKNTIGETNVLTTSAQRGLVSQQTYFSKSVASDNLDGYFLVERGDFAYNRSSSNGYPYGAIKRLDDSERGVLSTLNICLSLTNSDDHDSDYFVHVFEAGYLNRGLSQICQEGARSHGLLNVSREDFFGLEIPIPDKATQVQIADKLNLVQSELYLLRSQLSLLQRQKRGLMQKLLTGTWRVPVPKGSP